MPVLQTVSVIGAGGWGTALAMVAHRTGSTVQLYTRNDRVLESLHKTRVNDVYLPERFVDPEIIVTSDLESACRSQILILSVPAQQMRTLCVSLSDMVPAKTLLVIAAKGIERGSLQLMHEVVRQTLPKNPIAILSGPNFAAEVADGKPTATTIACSDHQQGNMLLHTLGGKYFRPYLTDDVIGAQIGGALKNVVAIAAGITDGLHYGENARAALITRGIAEMARLCEAKGGRAETLLGLCGIGDVMLTCTSTTSRNYKLGKLIGEYGVEQTIAKYEGTLTEGIATAESAAQLADSLSISMPVCQTVWQILSKEQSLDEALQSLLKRPFSTEAHFNTSGPLTRQ